MWPCFSFSLPDWVGVECPTFITPLPCVFSSWMSPVYPDLPPALLGLLCLTSLTSGAHSVWLNTVLGLLEAMTSMFPWFPQYESLFHKFTKDLQTAGQKQALENDGRGTTWCPWFSVFCLLQSVAAMISSAETFIYPSEFFVRIHMILQASKHQ